MDDVLATIAALGMTWDRYNPKSGRVDNGILKRKARGWMKMMVCNLKPLRHETTYSWDTIMLFYTLMDSGSIHLGRIINKSMYDAAIAKRDQRLAFPEKRKARKGDLPRPAPPPIHEQPSSSAAAAQPAAAQQAAQPLLTDASCTDLFKNETPSKNASREAGSQEHAIYDPHSIPEVGVP
ncbi:hypothetical protein PIB30_055263 [Stylosanthes scabra]|uniref:Uncharacterized protein n=1 Tax=Stylosanthes scabra TaxID=79078 RepID=A0ABU6QJR8_9FABA|nr:hypothetical protein [Stylosanthes scabra]